MIAALLVAAAVSAAPIAADGRLDAPEGFRARLPAGFRYESLVDGGKTTYRAADLAGGSVVTVGLEDVGEQAQCPESGEVEAQGVRMQVTAVRTHAGLDGCVIRGRAAEGTMVLAFVYGPERTAVAVVALAKSPDRADRLARGVAESVSFAPPAPADPRMIACFRRESSSSVPGLDAGAPAFVGVKWTTRCFLQDHRYFEQTGVAIPTARTESEPAEGRWRFRAGRLHVVTAEGPWSATVQFQGDALVLDGRPWERLAAQAADDEGDASEDE